EGTSCCSSQVMLEGKNSTYKEESQVPATTERPWGQYQEIENEEEDKKIVVDKDSEKQFEKKNNPSQNYSSTVDKKLKRLVLVLKMEIALLFADGSRMFHFLHV
ncbi:unnamed protein product, partial [Coccothraustes coccothraustes]